MPRFDTTSTLGGHCKRTPRRRHSVTATTTRAQTNGEIPIPPLVAKFPASQSFCTIQISPHYRRAMLLWWPDSRCLAHPSVPGRHCPTIKRFTSHVMDPKWGQGCGQKVCCLKKTQTRVNGSDQTATNPIDKLREPTTTSTTQDERRTGRVENFWEKISCDDLQCEKANAILMSVVAKRCSF